MKAKIDMPKKVKELFKKVPEDTGCVSYDEEVFGNKEQILKFVGCIATAIDPKFSLFKYEIWKKENESYLDDYEEWIRVRNKIDEIDADIISLYLLDTGFILEEYTDEEFEEVKEVYENE